MPKGMPPGAGRPNARRRFGAAEPVRARSRGAPDSAWLDETARNVRFALRAMARSPVLTGAFVLTLALCIGFGTAVFSAVDSMLWRPLPYPDADRLALAGLHDAERGALEGQVGVDGATWIRIRDEADGFETAVYSGWVKGVNLSTHESARFVLQQRVSAGFFATLGVAPFMGREFTAAEDVPNGSPVAVLSHGLWTESFGADAAILGRAVRLKGELHTVVGVMPKGFRSDQAADVWTPLRASTAGEGSGTNYNALVRLPEGMTWEEARARFAAIEPPPGGAGGVARRFGLIPLEDALSAGLRLPLLVLLGAVGLLILVGCANLAGVQVSRAVARETEMSTRRALGGGTGALVRQLLAENAVLGLLGGALGLGVATLTLGGLELLFRANLGATEAMALDGRAFAVAFGLTFLATFVFGIVPVPQLRRTDALRLLVSGTRGIVGGTGRTVRRALLVGQVAVVTVLLFGAVLLARSYGHLATLEPGFDPRGVTTVQLSLDDARYADAEAASSLFDGTVRDLRDLPDVSHAAVALSLPYERPLNMPFRVGGDDGAGSPRLTNLVYVTPGFFETLDVPVRDGRSLTEADRYDAAPVAVVNQAFVDAYLDGRRAPGMRIDLQTGAGEVEIVGVVADVLQGGAGWGSSAPVWTAPTAYVPVSQVAGAFLRQIHVWFSPSWVIRAPGASPGLQGSIAGVFESWDRELPIARSVSLEEVMAEAFAGPRFQAVFLLVVAGFALLLAAVGLYGIVAQEAVRRRREMGVRMALGVSPGRAVLHAGLSGMRLAAAGLVLGGVLAAAAGRVLGSLVWGVSTSDPVTFLLLLSAIGGLTAVASFVPAARLGRLHPATVLRE